MTSSVAKLKIAGIWVGVIEVELENWSVSMLRQEVSKQSNMGTDSINLICAGKVLKDGDGSEKLRQLGVKNNSKILASRVSVEEGKSLKQELMADEERNRRLARVKAAVTALSRRHGDGSLPLDDFNIELEDQSGQKVHFSETDRQAIMMGLMLHANGKGLIRRQMFKDALEVLTMGEEAFSLCNPKSIELVDNISILQIDMVWCYFMLRDIAWLSVAGVRLEKAREGLERAHGKDSSRFRLLQAGRSSELSLYLRLELLEGVVAYHSGQFDKCRKYLTSAQERFFQLRVPDEALSIVMGMGFKENDAKRALRMSNQDIESAINFLVEEKERKAKKMEDDIRRRAEIREQRRYGETALKKAVDLQRLKELVSLGFEKELAAEALRRNENDSEKALDDLTNPQTNTAIQHDIESRKRKRNQRKVGTKIEQLVSMGFERSRVVEAVRAGGSVEQAMQQLLTGSMTNPTASATNSDSISRPTSDAVDSLNQDNLSDDNDTEGPSASEVEQRDLEMEDTIAEEIAKGDALSDYDIEVTKEGEAINEYMALLNSVDSSNRASSSK
ncbi:NEDD8 ultimate buster 1 [Ricinus communis]|uniref:NEDD8 ultimate buster, putative n=1 Tax=Ricinus communis TaxID=3988 RepID=B9T241_RICCO|nr:NEDD8 ultimate buster 1 [Ricinus communis]EEF30062.1 NEDD8 ultimate buster, putative [Ricinus communis]|eukprot:XP_002532310.1 NEDD8 ultimate buster 1 [Ricinus communis]